MLQINPRPLQTQQLALAAPRDGCQREQRLQAVILSREPFKKGSDMLRGQRDDLDSRHLRPIYRACYVSRNHTPCHRLVESLPDGGEAILDRTGRRGLWQRTPATPRFLGHRLGGNLQRLARADRGEHSVDMPRLQSGEPMPSDDRDDVAVDVVTVPAEATRVHRALDRGKPPFQERLDRLLAGALRALAKGLATDDFLAEGYDPVRADAFYRQLMEAAGYLSGLPIGRAPPESSTDEDAVDRRDQALLKWRGLALNTEISRFREGRVAP